MHVSAYDMMRASVVSVRGIDNLHSRRNRFLLATTSDRTPQTVS